MINLALFRGLELDCGFTISRIDLADGLVEAIGRKASAQTRITGKELFISILSGMDEKELSVTIYHEVLEAITVGCLEVPLNLTEFNEGDFEQAGYRAHDSLGTVSPANLNRMLHFYGFGEN